MPLYNIAFWFCAFFLLGVFFISIFNQFLLIILAVLLASLYFLIFKKYAFATLVLFAIVGAGYYQISDNIQKSVAMPFDESTEFYGVVRKLEQAPTHQKLVVSLESPYQGRIKVNVQRYPEFVYGDLVQIKGIIKKPFPESEKYFAKDGIFGISNFPKIEKIKSGQGSAIMAGLLKFKNQIKGTFKSILPQEKAAFLSGITLGERESFSKELEEKMSISGTTHLVALSGYNISVIAWAVALIFGSFFSKTISFYGSVSVIVLFVLMTGAEASVVRAAIMGIIALLALQAERMYSLRNAIVITAFLMVVFNPKVLVFDLGFQLSFAALLGIVYLSPVVKSILRIRESGFLSWKQNALITFSAQAAVVPFLLGTFGVFSLTSFVANILILEAVPLTMGIGFVAGGLGFISNFLAQIVGWLLNLFLTYELWIIDIFSKITLPIITESFGFFAAIIYYLLLVGFIYKFRK